ncbi:MAG: winged helix-turn-helix domain-containing protein [Bdellovibrionota bacterium]
MNVFLARLKSVIRRAERFPYPVAAQREKIALCGIELDPITHQATVEEAPVHLTVTEFGLLRSLMSRPNEVWSRDDLLMRVAGPIKWLRQNNRRTRERYAKNSVTKPSTL